MDPVEQLLHPVRLRIVHALAAGRTLTTTQLCARLPEVSKVTVYRQVALLTEGGFLEVESEQRVRGAVERRYRLRQDRPAIDAAAAAAMSLDDHRRGFAAAMAVLISEFNAYLDRDGADPVADAVSYRQGTLWLSPEELAAMVTGLLAVLRGSAANTPAPGRAPYLLSAILFPAGQAPPDEPDDGGL
ncbi:helix-turn-helix domain-containing protein [Nonomuraea zeae]|uniref:ArsR family transcriptional regulator n=1 Tax=Nonomuraea zeae TaxID=1642303 RepID=A0A5S4G3E6_9ACTN|nr:helix-turn-helix domain-containing protein [Nonomuraea zeae]TMR27537.1 ArsR family transcriptional regulator [Nonomuraea zeae]